MRKITSLAVSTILVSLLLVGCASKEETEVSLNTDNQTKIMNKLKEMAHLQELQNEKILQEKVLIRKAHAKLLEEKEKLHKEKEELEALKKAMDLKNKKSIHSFYSEM